MLERHKKILREFTDAQLLQLHNEYQDYCHLGTIGSSLLRTTAEIFSGNGVDGPVVLHMNFIMEEVYRILAGPEIKRISESMKRRRNEKRT